MKLSVNTTDLVNALTIATHALATRSTLTILEGVLIETKENGISLTCSDGSMTISVSVPATVLEEGRVVMPGRLFGDVVRKLPDGELQMTVSINMIATLKCCGSRTTMAGKQADLFPQLPQIDETHRVQLPQELLRDMIQQTLFAVSADESRKILTGCLLEIGDGEARMVGCDGFRLAVRVSAIEPNIPQLRAIIPGKLLQELSKIISGEDEATLIFGSNQLLVEMKDVKIYASLLEGEYIQYRRIIPAAAQTTVHVLDKELMMLSVERASLMARENKVNMIKMSIGPTQMVITANSEMGDVREEVPVETDGEPLDIAFNVKYVTDVLKAIDGNEFIMRFNSAVSPCVLAPVEGSAYTYMILPLRNV